MNTMQARRASNLIVVTEFLKADHEEDVSVGCPLIDAKSIGLTAEALAQLEETSTSSFPAPQIDVLNPSPKKKIIPDKTIELTQEPGNEKPAHAPGEDGVPRRGSNGSETSYLEEAISLKHIQFNIPEAAKEVQPMGFSIISPRYLKKTVLTRSKTMPVLDDKPAKSAHFQEEPPSSDNFLDSENLSPAGGAAQTIELGVAPTKKFDRSKPFKLLSPRDFIRVKTAPACFDTDIEPSSIDDYFKFMSPSSNSPRVLSSTGTFKYPRFNTLDRMISATSAGDSILSDGYLKKQILTRSKTSPQLHDGPSKLDDLQIEPSSIDNFPDLHNFPGPTFGSPIGAVQIISEHESDVIVNHTDQGEDAPVKQPLKQMIAETSHEDKAFPVKTIGELNSCFSVINTACVTVGLPTLQTENFEVMSIFPLFLIFQRETFDVITIQSHKKNRVINRA